jgi:hypothetical protein
MNKCCSVCFAFVDSPGIIQPECSFEVQQWQKGCYTLLCDDRVHKEYALDVTIHFNVHDVKQLQGGFISYVARDAGEEVNWCILLSCTCTKIIFS